MNEDTQSRWYSRHGIWFWIVIGLGAALGFYLVVFTDGAQDVAIWERHARDVRDHGLIGYYWPSLVIALRNAAYLLFALPPGF
jgi:hypothetical protein